MSKELIKQKLFVQQRKSIQFYIVIDAITTAIISSSTPDDTRRNLRKAAFIPLRDPSYKILRRNKRKCSPVWPITFFFPLIISLRSRRYDRNGTGGSQAQEAGVRLFPAALRDSPKKRKGTLRSLIEENSFPRQRSYERVTARSAECRGWMPAGRKVARKTSYCNYRPQHAVLWGYEFNHRRSANFAETRKPTSRSLLGRQDRHVAL